MAHARSFITLIILTVIISLPFVASASAIADEIEARTILNDAQNTIASAFEAVLKAEAAGANVSGLLAQLDNAGASFADARIAFNSGDFETAIRSANSSESVAIQVREAASQLEALATNEGRTSRLFVMITSVTSMSLVALGSIWIWHFLKKRRT